MILEWRDSLIKAGQVIDALQQMFDNDIKLSVVAPKEKVSIESYQNGREHGYSIFYVTPAAVAKGFYICENRHSSDVRVYHGSNHGSGLAEDAWKNARDFGAHGYGEAAKYICDTLVEEFKDVQ